MLYLKLKKLFRKVQQAISIIGYGRWKKLKISQLIISCNGDSQAHAYQPILLSGVQNRGSGFPHSANRSFIGIPEMEPLPIIFIMYPLVMLQVSEMKIPL